MRIAAILVVVLCGCAGSPPADGPAAGFLAVDGVEVDLVACERSIVRAHAPINDASALEMSTGESTITANWRGEPDRWYPLAVSGSLDRNGVTVSCSLTVDVGQGAWIVSGTCGSADVYAEATGCE